MSSTTPKEKIQDKEYFGRPIHVLHHGLATLSKDQLEYCCQGHNSDCTCEYCKETRDRLKDDYEIGKV